MSLRDKLTDAFDAAGWLPKRKQPQDRGRTEVQRGAGDLGGSGSSPIDQGDRVWVWFCSRDGRAVEVSNIDPAEFDWPGVCRACGAALSVPVEYVLPQPESGFGGKADALGHKLVVEGVHGEKFEVVGYVVRSPGGGIEVQGREYDHTDFTAEDVLRWARGAVAAPTGSGGEGYYCNKCGYAGFTGPEHPGCRYLAGMIAPTPTEEAEVERVKLTPEEAERLLAEKDREIERLKARADELKRYRDMTGENAESQRRRAEKAERDLTECRESETAAQQAGADAIQRASKLEGLVKAAVEQFGIRAEEAEAVDGDATAEAYREAAGNLRGRLLALQAQHSR